MDTLKDALSTSDPIKKAFHSTERYCVNNIGVLGVDPYGRRFHDVEIPRLSDVVHDFESNADFDFLIGKSIVPKKLVNSLLLFLSIYTPISIRLYIEDGGTSDTTIHLSYTCTLLNDDVRKYCTGMRLVHNALLYDKGICSPLQKIVVE